MSPANEYYGLRNEPSVDVWSLGAVCYRVLAGEIPPADKHNLHDIKRRLGETGLPQEAVEALGAVGPKVQRVVKACLSYDSAKRPAAVRVAIRLREYASELEHGRSASDAARSSREQQRLQTFVRSLEAQRNHLQAEVESGTGRVKSLEAAIEDLKAQNEALTSQNDSLQAKNAQVEAWRDEMLKAFKAFGR